MIDKDEKIIHEYELFESVMRYHLGRFKLIETATSYKLIYAVYAQEKELILSKGSYHELLKYHEFPKKIQMPSVTNWYRKNTTYLPKEKREFKFYIEEFKCHPDCQSPTME